MTTTTDTRPEDLRARDSQLCGFIPMIGQDQDGERSGPIADDVALYWDHDQPIDPAALQGILTRPGITVWSGASVLANESTDPIWPRLTGTEPETCRFAAEPAAIERRWELGAIGHGAAGAQLAERLCEQIRAWHRDRTAQPIITAYPAGTPHQNLAAKVVINKRFIRLVVSS